MTFISRIINNYKKMDVQNQRNVRCILYGFSAGLLLFLIALLIFFAVFSASSDGTGNIVCGGDLAVYNDNVYYCNDDGIKAYNIKDGKTVNAADIENCTNLVVWEDNLYFIGGMSHRGIYKTDLKSGNTEMLIKTPASQLDVKDGIMIYFSADDGRIFQADADGKFRRAVTALQADSFCFDGRYVYFSNGTGFFRYDVKKCEEIEISRKYSGNLLNEYNGRLFYYNSNDKTVNCLIKKNGKNLVVAKCENGCDYLNVYPKGKRLFYSDGELIKQIKIGKSEFNQEECNLTKKCCIYDGCCYYLEEQSVKCVKIEEILD